jgi:replicative DNA helicase
MKFTSLWFFPAGIKRTRRPLNEIFVEHGKVPPQATDLEETILGAMMLEKDACAEVIEILKPEVFYKESHQVIFSSIQRLFANTEPIDILTVTEALRKSGELEIAAQKMWKRKRLLN